MKFVILAIVLALTLAAQASVISWAPHHHSEWSAWGNGLGHGHHNSWDDGHHGHWDDGHHGHWDDGHHGHWDDGHHGHWDDGHHGHWDDGHWGHETHGISLDQGSAWDHHHHVHHAPAHHAHHDHHHDGHYVAKTRGAVHTAPLPGHIDSVKSINVAPAPGTH